MPSVPPTSGLPPPALEALRREVDDHAMLDQLAELMNAAGNETRLRILYVLWRGAEVRVNDLAEILGLTTPAVSQQLKKLRRHGLVLTRRNAQTVYYRLDAAHGMIRCLTFIFHEGAFPSYEAMR